MKTIIAGSRTITDYAIMQQAINACPFAHEITEVVSGGARGVDELGELWAVEHMLNTTVFPADWNTYGKSAGPIRNREMARYADALIAIWDGKSRGTKRMIEIAKFFGLNVFVYGVFF